MASIYTLTYISGILQSSSSTFILTSKPHHYLRSQKKDKRTFDWFQREEKQSSNLFELKGTCSETRAAYMHGELLFHDLPDRRNVHSFRVFDEALILPPQLSGERGKRTFLKVTETGGRSFAIYGRQVKKYIFCWNYSINSYLFTCAIYVV